MNLCDVERSAWRPPERLTTTEWAEKERILTGGAHPGPYRVSRTPYAKGVMDALSDPQFDVVAVMKPVQTGLSEVGRNWIGRNCHVDPAPTMIVFPTEQACKETLQDFIVPMFEDTPCLRSLLTGRKSDVSKSAVRLRSCTIYPGWSGSPQSIASKPIRWLMLDELDKYVAWNGKEGDPSALAEARTTTFLHNKKIYKLSTPTVRNGPIDSAVKSCGDIRDFCVKCVQCGEYELPEFENLDWEGRDTQDEDGVRDILRRLEIGEIEVRYECSHCGEHMTHRQFKAAARKGEWVSVGYRPGEHPDSRSLGLRLSGLCAIPGITGVAVEWMKTRVEGPGRLQYFYNNTLGVPYWDENWGDPNLEVEYAHVLRMADNAPKPEIVPEWATAVVCGADTNKTGHEFSVYAIGLNYRMQLLEYGVTDGHGLMKLLDKSYRGEDGSEWQIRRMCVDVGGSNQATKTRTEAVYRLAKDDPTHIWPVKGHDNRGGSRMPITTSVHTYTPPDRNRDPFDVKLSILDVGYLKDLLAQYINEESWQPHCNVDHDFIRQICSERKTLVLQKVKPDKTVEEIWRWDPKMAGVPNHYWDCAVYALAAARTLEAGEQEPEPIRPATTYYQEPSWDVGRKSKTWV